jgi:hypothetical protein
MYAPGFIDPSAEVAQSTEHMKDLTGFNIEMINEKFDPVFRYNGESHEISDRLDKRELFGRLERKRYCCLGVPNEYTIAPPYLYPLFYPSDESATVIAHFLTSPHPAVAVKKLDSYTSVFYGSKFIDSKSLRQIARFAGCHIWSESDDTVYANDSYVTHHASSTGRKKLYFKKKVSPYEVYEKRFYAEGVTELEFDSVLGETKMFKLCD